MVQQYCILLHWVMVKKSKCQKIYKYITQTSLFLISSYKLEALLRDSWFVMIWVEQIIIL